MSATTVITAQSEYDIYLSAIKKAQGMVQNLVEVDFTEEEHKPAVKKMLTALTKPVAKDLTKQKDYFNAYKLCLNLAKPVYKAVGVQHYEKCAAFLQFLQDCHLSAAQAAEIQKKLYKEANDSDPEIVSHTEGVDTDAKNGESTKSKTAVLSFKKKKDCPYEGPNCPNICCLLHDFSLRHNQQFQGQASADKQASLKRPHCDDNIQNFH
ncbi:hypothetical protein GYMLUDRAFT_251726 [Collybiopsis luxurians FD-317 M1]|uniref:Unplaced genomic scaffold GYMLUscaffold_106, whole genome shotgun sequence n=1 Tax=Collybiopsis luxurians FD-317 M1 TaxID=944289 RepID=A0A0D0ANH2_9AGAR|nr:hypothetical protein GYMLUDRAFT_251726 [Collybiopsis luxurians FD-317 M1]